MTPIERRVLRDRLRELTREAEDGHAEMVYAEGCMGASDVRRWKENLLAMVPDMIAAMREAAAEIGS